MSRRGSKVFPGLNLEKLESSPSLTQGKSFNGIENDDDNVSIGSTASKRRRRSRKNSSTQQEDNESTKLSAPSPRTAASPRVTGPSPRTTSFQPIQASMINSSPSPRQRRLSRQASFDAKTNTNTANNQTNNNVPPLRRAKSVRGEDDTSSVTSGTPVQSARKSNPIKKSIRKSSNSSKSGKKKVSFRNPIIEPEPEGVTIYYLDDNNKDLDGESLEEEMEKRKLRHRQKYSEDSSCGVGCLIS